VRTAAITPRISEICTTPGHDPKNNFDTNGNVRTQ
jgi:hypothetical protein